MKILTDKLQIIQAVYITDYRIRFVFSDGIEKEVDFYPFLSQPYQNPMVSQYLDKNRFSRFKITKHSDISWDDYEMCFPLETLYTGKF